MFCEVITMYIFLKETEHQRDEGTCSRSHSTKLRVGMGAQAVRLGYQAVLPHMEQRKRGAENFL